MRKDPHITGKIISLKTEVQVFVEAFFYQLIALDVINIIGIPELRTDCPLIDVFLQTL